MYKLKESVVNGFVWIFSVVVKGEDCSKGFRIIVVISFAVNWIRVINLLVLCSLWVVIAFVIVWESVVVDFSVLVSVVVDSTGLDIIVSISSVLIK